MKVDYMRPNPWKQIKVTDGTKRTLSNGKVVPTWSNMLRLAHKSGK